MTVCVIQLGAGTGGLLLARRSHGYLSPANSSYAKQIKLAGRRAGLPLSVHCCPLLHKQNAWTRTSLSVRLCFMCVFVLRRVKKTSVSATSALVAWCNKFPFTTFSSAYLRLVGISSYMEWFSSVHFGTNNRRWRKMDCWRGEQVIRGWIYELHIECVRTIDKRMRRQKRCIHTQDQ